MATMRGLCSLLIPPSKRLQLNFKWCSECLSPLPPPPFNQFASDRAGNVNGVIGQ